MTDMRMTSRPLSRAHRKKRRTATTPRWRVEAGDRWSLPPPFGFPFGDELQAIFPAEPEGEVARRLAFLLRGCYAVGFNAGVHGVDAKKRLQSRVHGVPVVQEGHGSSLVPKLP